MQIRVFSPAVLLVLMLKTQSLRRLRYKTTTGVFGEYFSLKGVVTELTALYQVDSNGGGSGGGGSVEALRFANCHKRK